MTGGVTSRVTDDATDGMTGWVPHPLPHAPTGEVCPGQYDHSPSSSKPLQALPRGFSRFSRNEFTPTSTMNMHMNGTQGLP